MAYTSEYLDNLALRFQCCIASLANNVRTAELFNKPNKLKLKKELNLMISVYDMLAEYHPVGYIYEVNDYVETEDDQCIPDADLDYIVEKINSVCPCVDCLDVNDLLKDI